MSITRELARFFAAAKRPPMAETAAKLAILDTMGCAIGAFGEERVERIAKGLVAAGAGPDGDGAWGSIGPLPLLDAILINATYAHVLEMDDVHKASKVHAGAIVVPAALALGAFLHAPGTRVLDAVIAGYEVAHRIGVGLGVTPHRRRGWHATSTCGVFGAAATAAVLLGLDEDQFTSALGLAGTQAAGVWAFTADGAENKPFHAGSAARAGVMSAFLAGSGLKGPEQILEAADGGLFTAMSNPAQVNPAAILHELGAEWYVSGLTVKPFACCRSMHAPIEAMLDLRDQKGLLPEEVESIAVDTYDFAVDQCGRADPPRSRSEAQFSMAHGLAVALIDGQAAPAQFESSRYADEHVMTLAKRVYLHRNAEFEERYPAEWGARLTVALRNGDMLNREVRVPKGDPENPLTQSNFEAKFVGLSNGTLGNETTQKLAAMIGDLQAIVDICQLTELLRTLPKS